MRGMELSADDLLRRAVIQALMCQFELSKQSMEISYLVEFDSYFAAELEQLAEYEKMGLVESEEGWIRVTARGRPLIREICMIFDHYLRRSPDSRSYSRIV